MYKRILIFILVLFSFSAIAKENGALANSRGPDGKCVDFLFPDKLMPKKTIQPKYPPKAFYRRKSGQAVIGFDISPEGKLENIEIVRTVPNNFGFGKAAKDAAEMMEYEPILSNGQPVKVECLAYTFTFTLTEIPK